MYLLQNFKTVIIKKIVLYSCICMAGAFGATQKAYAQLLNDKEAALLIQNGIQKMYNFKFAAAEQDFEKIKIKYPKHPVYPLLMSMHLSWKAMPMYPTKPEFKTYENYLSQTLQRAKVMLDKNDNDPEAIFFILAAHSYLALQAAEDEEMIRAVNEAKKTYNYMRDGMKLVSIYPEFYLSSGLYNYYVEQYPEDHAIVKPFMFFFADGNKALGLKQLEIASQKAVFTKTEALYYLLHIYVKHELQLQKALACSERLIRLYPNNLLFVMRQTELLIGVGKFEAAQPFLDQLKAQTDKVYQSTVAIFQGIIEEKQHKNYAAAQKYYQKAISMNAIYSRYNKDYYAMAYTGLARLAVKDGDKAKAKKYYQKALELAEYKSTIAEAKNYLKNA
jgi:tetratricopeptide (TPR) repeat protein